MSSTATVYERIHLLVCQIPCGQVMTYGQIAAIVSGCTPRMVGYAMAGLPVVSNVPWHRVVNAKGGISPRGNPDSAIRQRLLLEEEGVDFKEDGCIDLKKFRWSGPDLGWLITNGFEDG